MIFMPISAPAAMEATHDLDFIRWCFLPAKPVRVYSEVNYGAMREATGAAEKTSVAADYA